MAMKMRQKRMLLPLLDRRLMPVRSVLGECDRGIRVAAKRTFDLKLNLQHRDLDGT